MKIFLIFAFLILNLNAATAQPVSSKAKLTNTTVVKDSSDKVYSFNVWRDLVMTGKATLQPIDPENEHSDFLIFVLSEEEYERKLESLPAPPPSKFFTTGQSIVNFNATDINGSRHNLKSLKGKVVVINFWYIACAPCQMEIPELNNVAAEYKDSSDVVFLAIGLDDKEMIKKFIELKPFHYALIGDGRSIAGSYGVAGYPTNVVLDREGKVRFHTSGYGINTIPWLRKSIAKALQ